MDLAAMLIIGVICFFAGRKKRKENADEYTEYKGVNGLYEARKRK